MLKATILRGLGFALDLKPSMTSWMFFDSTFLDFDFTNIEQLDSYDSTDTCPFPTLQEP